LSKGKVLSLEKAELVQLSNEVKTLQESLTDESKRFLKYKDLVRRYDVLSQEGGEIALIKQAELDMLKGDSIRYKEVSQLVLLIIYGLLEILMF